MQERLITVRELLAALAQFPEEATCLAYEGEEIGLWIEAPDWGATLQRGRTPAQGWIGCVTRADGTVHITRFPEDPADG